MGADHLPAGRANTNKYGTLCQTVQSHTEMAES